MRSLILYLIALMMICLYGTGCTFLTRNPTATPTATPTDPPPTFTIDTPGNKTTMAIGVRTRFDLTMEPNHRAQVNSVIWTGNYGIVCELDKNDFFIGYCTAKDNTQIGDATVSADIEGIFSGGLQKISFAVEIMPGPTDTPTPTPTEEPVDTPTPTEEPPPTDTPTPANTPTFTPTVPSPPPAGDILPVADFDLCEPTSNLGTLMGPAYNSPDILEVKYERYESEPDRDCVAKLDYEVVKEFAVFFIKLEGLDASNYDTLTFSAKGDPVSLPESVKVEIKRNDNNEVSASRISDLTEAWQQFTIPFNDFAPQFERDNLSELVFTFDSNSGSTGTMYLDDIALTSASVSTDTPSPPPTEPPAADTPTPTGPAVTNTPIPPPPPPSPTTTDGCPFDDIPSRSSIGGSPVDLEVSFTSIPNCADNLPTATSFPLSGTISRDLTDNEELWILVYPPDFKYYPQTTDACAEEPKGRVAQIANGEWRVIIRLGRPGVPEAFHIVAVVTEVGSPASNDFHKYLIDGCAENWGSVPIISNGATELDSIIVHTR